MADTQPAQGKDNYATYQLEVAALQQAAQQLEKFQEQVSVRRGRVLMMEQLFPDFAQRLQDQLTADLHKTPLPPPAGPATRPSGVPSPVGAGSNGDGGQTQQPALA